MINGYLTDLLMVGTTFAINFLGYETSSDGDFVQINGEPQIHVADSCNAICVV